MTFDLCLVTFAFAGGVVGIAVFVAFAVAARGVMRALWAVLVVAAFVLALLGFAWGGLGVIANLFAVAP